MADLISSMLNLGKQVRIKSRTRLTHRPPAELSVCFLRRHRGCWGQCCGFAIYESADAATVRKWPSVVRVLRREMTALQAPSQGPVGLDGSTSWASCQLGVILFLKADSDDGMSWELHAHLKPRRDPGPGHTSPRVSVASALININQRKPPVEGPPFIHLA